MSTFESIFTSKFTWEKFQKILHCLIQTYFFTNFQTKHKVHLVTTQMTQIHLTSMQKSENLSKIKYNIPDQKSKIIYTSS